MTLQTLIKQAQQSGFVVIPRREYDELLDFKKSIPIFKPTKAELKAIERGEREFREGKFTPWEEVKNELARNRLQKRTKKT